ncbi:MAG: hypothetical protein PF513_07720 [Tenericutes bacterium]|jgi:AGZA family xanthine/uracil permease-like MFS transporter|nr:hypothetical protein [Mycoplasmatota bacterium]
MQFIKNLFKLEERSTNIKTELLAGLTTSLAMDYILPVNSSMLGTAVVLVGGVLFHIAISAALASISS